MLARVTLRRTPLRAKSIGNHSSVLKKGMKKGDRHRLEPPDLQGTLMYVGASPRFSTAR